MWEERILKLERGARWSDAKEGETQVDEPGGNCTRPRRKRRKPRSEEKWQRDTFQGILGSKSLALRDGLVVKEIM